MLYDIRSTMINAFVTRDILPEDVEEDVKEDVYLEERPEYEESIAERTKRRKQI